MPRDPQSTGDHLYPQVDLPSDSLDTPTAEPVLRSDEVTRLLKDLVDAQDRQNELLEELVSAVATTHRQRASELVQWKKAHPRLSRECRRAAEVLGKVQTDLLKKLTVETAQNAEALLDGEYYLGEYLDRFGPRLAHLNAVLQVLSHLGGTPPSED